ncbi:phospholipase A [Pseudomarimonas arenosa]|uniref:Phospholipase A1 n=1 Tax=Pseudomarimonas arenosa TaxID=2774145 RepID=A0AAW3ZRN9_9GAMM|nr:phospholipase A [Pseudomarimonas arenosa]MBD8526911.1 phospholipase A [Pseudomarimonas arenosa]
MNHSIHARLALLLALLTLPSTAPASDESPSALLACRLLQSDSERLACYDRLAAAEHERHVEQRRQDIYRNDPSPWAKVEAIDRSAEVLLTPSLLDRRWELADHAKLGTFNLRAHKPIYLLPLVWSSHPNQLPRSENPANTVTESLGLRNVENKFQLSFKTKFIEGLIHDRGDLWFGYTQSSRWQLYDDDKSRPFRETNYEPEAMLVFGFDQPFGGWRGRMFGLSAVHQSNGRGLPLSRSWDRLMLTAAMERENWVVQLRPWWRIPESSHDDDNPDIENYMGRGDLHIVHRRKDHEIALMLRHSLRSGDDSNGALQLDWSFPLVGNLRGHFQLFDGYGESLIDYNHRATYVGLGVSLLPWY